MVQNQTAWPAINKTDHWLNPTPSFGFILNTHPSSGSPSLAAEIKIKYQLVSSLYIVRELTIILILMCILLEKMASMKGKERINLKV